mgnify:CR=1 FL=1
MKKLLAILLVLCMVIPAAALGEEVVKIGVYEPATGDSGAGGKQEMLGMQYANELFPTVKIGTHPSESAPRGAPAPPAKATRPAHQSALSAGWDGRR